MSSFSIYDAVFIASNFEGGHADAEIRAVYLSLSNIFKTHYDTQCVNEYILRKQRSITYVFIFGCICSLLYKAIKNTKTFVRCDTE